MNVSECFFTLSSVRQRVTSVAVGGAGRAIPYLTDASHDTAAQPPVPVVHGSFGATLPARSLVTFFIPAH